MTDRKLLDLLKEDKAGGMETLLAQYGALLRYVIRGILRDPQDVEDC